MLYLFLIISYLIGSLSFAIIVSKVYKLDDPRNYGSKNAGATNVMRSGNKKAALLTLAGDFLKGVLVVAVARILFRKMEGYETLVALSGILVIIGHIYPLYFKFSGGKGVATALGVILILNPFVALLMLITWGIVFGLSRISSLAAIVAAISAPLYAYTIMGDNSYFGAILLIAFFILYTHKINIMRLLALKEHTFKK